MRALDDDARDKHGRLLLASEVFKLTQWNMKRNFDTLKAINFASMQDWNIKKFQFLLRFSLHIHYHLSFRHFKSPFNPTTTFFSKCVGWQRECEFCWRCLTFSTTEEKKKLYCNFLFIPTSKYLMKLRHFSFHHIRKFLCKFELAGSWDKIPRIERSNHSRNILKFILKLTQPLPTFQHWSFSEGFRFGVFAVDTTHNKVQNSHGNETIWNSMSFLSPFSNPLDALFPCWRRWWSNNKRWECRFALFFSAAASMNKQLSYENMTS